MQLIAAQPGHRGPAVQAGGGEHLDQRLAVKLGTFMGLGEIAGHHPRPEPEATGVEDRLPGQQPEEVALAGPVGPEDRDPLTEEDLGVERRHQSGQTKAFHGDRPDRGPATGQPHRHLLLGWSFGRPGGAFEPAQPGLHRLGLGGEHVRE